MVMQKGYFQISKVALMEFPSTRNHIDWKQAGPCDYDACNIIPCISINHTFFYPKEIALHSIFLQIKIVVLVFHHS